MSPLALDEELIDSNFSHDRWQRQGYFDDGFKAYVLGRIEVLRRLQPGWDGYAARRIDDRIAAAAREFVNRLGPHLAPRPLVVPLASGGLQFEWHSGEVTLELEFESPDSIHYLKWNPADDTSEESTFPPTDRCQGEELLKWFTRQSA